MPNLPAVLKDEIRRLAKKEAKGQVAALRAANAQYRHDIAVLKRANKVLSGRVAYLEAGRRKSEVAAPNVEYWHQVRFAPERVASHRQKIGLSQADYGWLVGVSATTICNWEKGKFRPQKKQLMAWGAVKTMGKREALRQLEATA